MPAKKSTESDISPDPKNGNPALAGSPPPPRMLNLGEAIDATQLLGATGEVKLLHNGELYSLRRTRQGKLILTK